MKLAEALQRRADINSKISKLRSNMEDSVLVQENEEPDFDIAKLLKEHDELIEERTELIDTINEVNNKTVDPETGKTVAQLISLRDSLKTRMATYQQIVDKAGQKSWRSSGKEIRTVTTVKVKDIQKKVDEMAKMFGQVDNKIQMLNWATDIE